MAANGAIDHQTLQVVAARAKTLIGTQLKDICRKENLPVSGVKGTLQQRILDQLQHYAYTGNVVSFNRLRARINDPSARSSPDQWGYKPPHTPTTPYSPAPYPPTGLPRGMAPYQPAPTPTSYKPRTPRFKISPFYTILEPVTELMEIRVRENTRDHAETKITFRGDIADKLSRDESIRVMVYCAQDPILPFGQVDIAFPQQIEIKVNGDDVKENFRGLKNKPGSTRPADITRFLRKRAGYENGFKITYALTQKVEKPGSKFYVVVNLVKHNSPGILLEILKKGKIITKDQVKREMLSRNSDDDIEATSSILSLKCPISAGRMQTPCRSTVCSHNQCFDAMSFLQQNEQIPTWQCPVCNKIVSFEALEIDKYVEDILDSTPRATEQVTVEPNGDWHPIGIEQTGQRSPSADDDDDEDLVEVREPSRLPSMRQSSLAQPNSYLRTPPISASSREQSTSSARPTSNGSKRPAAQTIDLTLSSDDEETRPPPKRQMTSNPLATPVPDLPGHRPMPHRLPSMNSSGFMATPRQPENSPDRPMANYTPRGYPYG